jgi:hypothetical protein
MQATSTTFTCPHCEHKIEVHEAGDGEIITCTNDLCRKQFQAEIPRANPEPQLIVPPDARQSTAEQPASEEPLPPDAHPTGTDVVGPEPPTVVAVYHTPMFSRHPFRFLINIGLVVLGVAGIFTGLARDSQVAIYLSLIPLVFGVVRHALWWWKARQTVLTITNRGIVVSGGLATVTTREIHHDSIRGIDIFQPWVCGLLQSGAVVISYGDKDEEVYLDAIRYPHRVVEQIREQARK